MHLSVLDLYTIGIGPSSSHTMGPMRAAADFSREIGSLEPKRVKVELFGSLGLTGKGHGTHLAVISGLMGNQPETVIPETMQSLYDQVEEVREILIPQAGTVPFNVKKDLVFNRPQSAHNFFSGMVDRVKLFCTVYDPNTGRYRFDYSLFVQITIGGLAVLAVFTYLLVETRRARRKKKEPSA